MSKIKVPESLAVDKFFLVHNIITGEFQAVYAPTEREACWKLDWLSSDCSVEEIPGNTNLGELEKMEGK